jgi:hypothetical protein
VRQILAADNPSNDPDASIFTAASAANAGIGVFCGVFLRETSSWRVSDNP